MCLFLHIREALMFTMMQAPCETPASPCKLIVVCVFKEMRAKAAQKLKKTVVLYA